MFGFQPHLWGFRWCLAPGVAEADQKSPLKRASLILAARNPGVNAWATEKVFSNT